jgi:hypothetical protein
MAEQDIDIIAMLKAPPIEDMLDALATSVDLPAAPIAACLLRFDEARPALLALLERAAAGDELDNEARTLFFRGLHILSGHKEPLAFEPLLRLLRRSDDELQLLLGDAITDSLAKIAAGAFDGNADALFEAIAAKDMEEYARHALFGAATFLTFDGKIERERMERFLRSFHEERSADEGSVVWTGFVDAIALLALRDLAPLAQQAIREEWLPGYMTTLQEFAKDLDAAEREAGDDERFKVLRLGYIDDVYDVLSSIKRDRTAPPPTLSRSYAPVINPMRHVGRNDPCPCGSGRKAKKCCLAAA